MALQREEEEKGEEKKTGEVEELTDDSQESLSTVGNYDFISLLNQKEFSDIVLIAEGKKIYAHQVILASRSQYFEALFSHNFKENVQKEITFNDIPYDFFMLMLKHIYSDKVTIEKKNIYDILSVSLFFTFLAR